MYEDTKYKHRYSRLSQAVNNDTEFKTETHCQLCESSTNPVFFCDIVYKETQTRW